MAVKFTKPEINVREKLAELDKPSGIAGEAMLRAETPQEQQALIGVGRRNLIINGDFQVWQRGTSFSSGFTADRWYTAAGTATKDGLAYKHVATNTDPYLLYKVEDIGNRFADKDAIASFYLKTSSGINKLQYLTVCNVNYTHDVMYELPSEIEGYTRWACPVKLTDVHTDYIRIVVELEAVSGNISYLRQFQLELGKVATPFEHRSYGEELALCQRYYQKVPIYYESIMGQAYSTTAARFPIQLPVEMRATPTLTVPGPGTSGNSFKPLNSSLSWPGGTGANNGTALSNRHFYITCTSYSGLVAGNASTIYSASNNTFITASAEL